MATPEAKDRVVRRLDGEIRSSVPDDEPDVASSDATNIQTAIRRAAWTEEIYVITSAKMVVVGVGDSRCKLAVGMGKNRSDAATLRQQSSPFCVPMDTPGDRKSRSGCSPSFGYDGAPHGSRGGCLGAMVRVPVSNILPWRGQRDLKYASGAPGPGRIHHLHARHWWQLKFARENGRKTRGRAVETSASG